MEEDPGQEKLGGGNLDQSRLQYSTAPLGCGETTFPSRMKNLQQLRDAVTSEDYFSTQLNVRSSKTVVTVREGGPKYSHERGYIKKGESNLLHYLLHHTHTHKALS